MLTADRLRQAYEEHRAAHTAFLVHFKGCPDCGGRLCRQGIGLDRDADAAGWRLDHP